MRDKASAAAVVALLLVCLAGSSQAPPPPAVCAAPPTVLHATFVETPIPTGPNENVAGTAVVYTCDTGYTGTGPTAITCISAGIFLPGKWNTSGLVCSAVHATITVCAVPPTTNHATVEVTPKPSDPAKNTVGTAAVYTCKPGYTATGATVLGCLASGKWNGTAPRCKKAPPPVCAAPPPVLHASFVETPVPADPSKNAVGTAAVYTCDTGYTGTGPTVIGCLSTEKWNTSGLVCTAVPPVVCAAPPTNSHATVVVTPKSSDPAKYAVGSTAVYTCKSGYTATGATVLGCLATGKWNGTAPTCKKTPPPVCAAPPTVPHATFVETPVTTDPSKSAVGTAAVYTCDTGYTGTGPAVIGCLSTGKWNTSGLVCNAVSTCAAPAIGFEVAISPKKTSYAIGATIHLACPAGLNLLDSQPSAKCQSGGVWSVNFTAASPPYCKAVECREYYSTEPIPFGYILLAKPGIADPSFLPSQRYHIYGAVVTYVCNKDDVIVGNATRTCSADGTWSGGMPYCQVPAKMCNADTCKNNSGSQTSCCILNSKSIGCCSTSVMHTIADRFDNVPSKCAVDLETELLPCGGRLVECMDNTKEQTSFSDCYPSRTFGCYRNQIAPAALGDELDQFCKMYAATTNTLSCLAAIQRTNTGKSTGQGFCLPANCQTQASLQAIVDSTLELYRDHDMMVLGKGYPLANGLQVTCRVGSNTTMTAQSYPKYPVPCGKFGKCANKQYPKWNQCCKLDNTEIGCCSQQAQDVLNSRFAPFSAVSQCRADMTMLLQPCLSELVQCYSNLTDIKTNNNCPDLHGCSVPLQGDSSKCEQYTGNGSAFCTKSCPGVPNCATENFCVPATCANAASLNAIAMGDARVSCSLWKNHDNQYCSWVNVTIKCDNGLTGIASLDDRAEECQAPFTPKDGHFNVTLPAGHSNLTYPIGTKISYHCNYGFAPTAPVTTITCETSGQWSRKGPDCARVNCGRPIYDNSTQVVLNGTSFNYGDVVFFECAEKGFHATPTSAKCLADRTWDYDNLAYCQAANCYSLYDLYGINNNYRIPFGTVRLLNSGAHDTTQPGEDNHLYGAKIAFICDEHTKHGKSTTLECQDNGEWSGTPPICSVPPQGCNASSDCAELSGHPTFTACCAYGSEANGPLCCPQLTKNVLDSRFYGLSGQCKKDFTESFSMCSTQVVDCFNQQEKDQCNLQVGRFYQYGCNSGVPVPTANEFTDQLISFCAMYGQNQSVACVEETTRVDQIGSSTISACLPASCAADGASLNSMAMSSLQTRCSVEGNPYYCSTATVKLTCANGISGMARQEASCNCPPSGQPTLTECCEVANFTLGCCSKSVKKTVGDRFMSSSDSCREAQYSALGICGPAIVNCLNYVEANRVPYRCPDYHYCQSFSGTGFCPMDEGNTTAYCATRDTGSRPYGGVFCLPPECLNAADVLAYATQDASIACEIYKLSTGNTTCGNISVNTDCYGSDGTNVSGYYNLYNPGHINVTTCNLPFKPEHGGYLPKVKTFIAGTTLKYYCDEGFEFAKQAPYPDYSVNITCLPFGGPSGHAPDCIPVNCPDVLGDLGALSHGRFPFGNVALTAEGANSSRCNGMDVPCAHTYGAQLTYTCDKGTVPMGSPVRMCLANGSWSGSDVFCNVPAQPCSTAKNTCPADNPVCITMGNNSTGVMCGKQTTQDLINMRFNGPTGQCLTDLTASYGTCATQIIDCLNNVTATTLQECLLDITRFYLYGCNNGAAPPIPARNVNRLRSFCAAHGPPNSFSCTQTLQNIDTTHDPPTSFCLPASCAVEDTANKMALSTLNIRCSALPGREFVCGVGEVVFNCHPPKTNATIVRGVGTPDVSCAKCPGPGQPATYTECCGVGPVTFGCCPRNVSAVLSTRFNGLSKNCTSQFSEQFLVCRAALLACLNKGMIFSDSIYQNCPGLHGCSALNTMGTDACKDETGVKSSVCNSFCSASVDSCTGRAFCLPGDCTNAKDVEAFTASEANLACLLNRQKSRQPVCGQASANLTCQMVGTPFKKFAETYSYSDVSTTAPSGPSGGPTKVPPTQGPKTPRKSKAGAIVGGLFGALAAVVLAVIFYLYYRRRRSNKSVRYTAMKDVHDDDEEPKLIN